MPSLTLEALNIFAREGDPVAFRVPWLERPVWWAPTAAEGARLVAWGVCSRGQVWTRDELVTLIALCGPEARAVVKAKLVVDGEVVETRPR